MAKTDQIENFDPNGIGNISENIYGLPFNCNNANLVIIPVPWEVTVFIVLEQQMLLRQSLTHRTKLTCSILT